MLVNIEGNLNYQMSVYEHRSVLRSSRGDAFCSESTIMVDRYRKEVFKWL